MALVVEDGTGLINSEAYISVADADTYHTNYSGSTDWSNATPGVKERTLRLSTLALDGENVLRWKGRRNSKGQALDWPRNNVRDASGFFIDSNVIPEDLRRANAELALREITDSDGILPDIDDNGRIKREKIKVGPIESDIEFVGVARPSTLYTTVKVLLRDLIQNPFVIERS